MSDSTDAPIEAGGTGKPIAPARVLVVDDDPVSSALQAHLASLLGHSAVTCTNQETAIDQALTGSFDLMLLDLGMPGLDGFEVLRRIRQRESQAQRHHLPVIAVTGYGSEADRLRCLMAGFVDHLSKPIRADSLARSIALALGALPTAAQAPTVQASDVERLRTTVRELTQAKPGDRSFAPTITESFAMRSQQLLETLAIALEERDRDILAQSAQALRSSSDFLGARRLAAMCTALLDDLERERWHAVGAALDAIANEHQAVLTLLFETPR